MLTKDTFSGRKRNEAQGLEWASKRQKTSRATPAGVFSCFTVDGNDVNLNRRSAFSPKRKEEVKGIRRKGACLRCRLLKRACSGEDPCKTCMAAARAAANSKALMWMECIRPSFQAINIFDKCPTIPDQARINSIMDSLLNDDVYLDFHIPFALNVEAASSHLAQWLFDDDAPSSFSVVGVFSCSTNTNLLQNALDPGLGRDLRLFVHLTTHLYTTGMQGGYHEYTDEEIQSVRDCVGNRLLQALDPLVRPSGIEASEDKLAKLRSLFLLLLGTMVGMRYTCSEVFEETAPLKTDLDFKQEALLRLMCHYLIYIGKATSLLEHSSDEKALLHKWRTHWNKPAAFTWNSTQGLEMHYRIEPPADWIVSSSEDESLSSIDIDLSEFDDVALFTQDSDLLKCTGCGTFWTSLDGNGLCQMCQPIQQNDVAVIKPFPEIDFTIHTTEDRLSFSKLDSTDPALDIMSVDAPITVCGDVHGQYYDPMRPYSEMEIPASVAVPAVNDMRSRGTCWRCSLQTDASEPAESICQRCQSRAERLIPLQPITFPLEIPNVNAPPGNHKYQQSEFVPAIVGSDAGALEVDHQKLDTQFGSFEPAAAISVSQHLKEHEEARRDICDTCMFTTKPKNQHRHPFETSSEKAIPRICDICHASIYYHSWCYGDCKDVVMVPKKERLLI